MHRSLSSKLSLLHLITTRTLIIIILSIITLNRPCFGMDKEVLWKRLAAAQEAGKTDADRLESFEKSITDMRDTSWVFITLDIKKHPHLRQQFETILLSTDINDLNKIKLTESLFSVLNYEYQHRSDNDENTKHFYKNLLKKLICRGLNFKQNIHYDDSFWQLFDEIVQENPDQLRALSNGFEHEIAGRREREERSRVEQETVERDRVQQQVQQTLRKRQQVLMTTTYLLLGIAAVAALSYVIYKHYFQPRDDKQEAQDNVQE